MNGEQSASNKARKAGALSWLLLLVARRRPGGFATTHFCRTGFPGPTTCRRRDAGFSIACRDIFRPLEHASWIGGRCPQLLAAFSTLLAKDSSADHLPQGFLPCACFSWLWRVVFFSSRLCPGVCVVGGLGAGLNMHYFPTPLGVWDIRHGGGHGFSCLGDHCFARHSAPLGQSCARYLAVGIDHYGGI